MLDQPVRLTSGKLLAIRARLLRLERRLTQLELLQIQGSGLVTGRLSQTVGLTLTRPCCRAGPNGGRLHQLEADEADEHKGVHLGDLPGLVSSADI